MQFSVRYILDTTFYALFRQWIVYKNNGNSFYRMSGTECIQQMWKQIIKCNIEDAFTSVDLENTDVFVRM